MDDTKKRENETISKRHFSKLHERIQNKYAQMQIRLEKSRSMESISALNEEFATENWTISENDVKDCEVPEEIKRESDHDNIVHNVMVEDVNKQNAVEDIVNNLLYEAEIHGKLQEDDEVFLEHSLSLENILEESVDQEIHFRLDSEPSSPTKRVSVRKRIRAAIERRRENRNREKIRKSELIGMDSNDKIILSNKPLEASKRKNKVASVAVALMEASGPENEAAVEEKARQLYCRIRLGHEKQKSKIAKINENLASWQELFNFNLLEDNLLEITMFEKEKDVYVGRAVVDLSELTYDKTHKMDRRLEEDDSIELLILVTISAMVPENVDTDQSHNDIMQNEIIEPQKHVSRLLLNDDFEHVGILYITAYEAAGLAASDCFAVFILGNDRCQTHTEHKTHDPQWQRTFTLDVKDATSILYITIHDEKKSDVVGRLAIPLLKIHNGLEKWFALKDVTCTERAKGRNPRIRLEMRFYFNFVRQSVRLINPKERVYMQVEPEFSRHALSRNIKRMKVIIKWITEAVKVTKSLFEWENKMLNAAALAGWLIFWYFYESWMLPLLLLIPFYWYRPAAYHFTSWQPEIFYSVSHGELKRSSSLVSVSSDISTTTLTSEKDTKTKTSFRQKLQSVADMIKTTQNGIGSAASIGESIKNLFNFTVPFISFFAIMAIMGISVVFYYMHVQHLLMIWGVHKYLRKILRPNRTPNNELMDLLSRVPDDETLLECNEIPLLTDEELQPHLTDKSKEDKDKSDKDQDKVKGKRNSQDKDKSQDKINGKGNKSQDKDKSQEKINGKRNSQDKDKSQEKVKGKGNKSQDKDKSQEKIKDKDKCL